MSTNEHATTEELLEAAFSVVRNSAVNTSLQQQSNYKNRGAVFSAGPCRGVIRGITEARGLGYIVYTFNNM
jgi:hypothetical protein